MNRPQTVPVEAEFVPADNEWVLGRRKGNKHVGEVVWWRPDGTLVCRSTFDDAGELHGVCRRFHPDGSIALESRYVHGNRWGKTWHTRSKAGGSPEDVHMAALPDAVHRIEMVYIGGECAPVFASLSREGADAPPVMTHGLLADFARDIQKYVVGTALRPLGSPVDIAGRVVKTDALFYRGLATTDATLFRFSASEEPTNLMSDPTATVLSLDQARDHLLIAVDLVDALILEDRLAPSLGAKLNLRSGTLSVRQVTPGSLASTLTLRAGDELARINGHPVTSVARYIAANIDWATSRRIEIDLQRDGEALTLRGDV